MRDGLRTRCRWRTSPFRWALCGMVAATVVGATACGASDAASSGLALPQATSRTDPVAFHGLGSLSLLSSSGFPTLHLQASGTSQGYLLTARGAGQHSRSCY